MHKTHVPQGLVAPLGAYSHAIEVPPGARWLYTAGQLGILPDGTIPEGAGAQAEIIWAGFVTILAAAGMGIENIVKTNAFLTAIADRPAYHEVRLRYLGDFRPTSTLVVVAGLAQPEFRLEVEMVAAKA